MKNPILAGVLSGVIPGLGQLYCGQWGKGTGFLAAALVLFGFLIGSVDLQKLQAAAKTGAAVDNMGQILLIVVLLLAVAIWSIVDAVRSAKKTS